MKRKDFKDTKNTSKDSNNTKSKDRWIEPGRRIMDIAYLRDDKNLYTGEALVIACLLKAQGKTRRGQDEVRKVAEMLDDPNLNRPKRK